MEQSPSIISIERRIEALHQQVCQAGAWLDPRVSIEYSNMPIDDPIPGRHPMSGIQLTLQQTFLFPGKLRLREAVAHGQVLMERQVLAERQLQLRAMVERSYYGLALVRQLREVTDRHIQLLDQFTDAVLARYRVGSAGQHDLLRLQVLGEKLRDDLHDFDRDDRTLVAALNAALHRPTSVAVPTPDRIAAPAAPADEDTLAGRAATERPLLRRYDEEVRTRRLAARRAAREGYSDLTAWFGYRIRAPSGTDAGTDFLGLGISAPLPLSYDRRWGSERRQEEALARAAEAERQAALDQIRGELGRVVPGWRRAVETARVYRTKLTPLAQQALDATYSAYKVGRADFASLYQADLQLLDFERAIRRAEAQAAIFRTEAEALVGAPLPSEGP